jgi:hypothetical protein
MDAREDTKQQQAYEDNERELTCGLRPRMCGEALERFLQRF